MTMALVQGLVLLAVLETALAVLIGRWVGMATAEQYQKRFEYEREMRKIAEQLYTQLVGGVARDLKRLNEAVEDRHHDIPYREVHGDMARFIIPRMESVDVREIDNYRDVGAQVEHGELQEYAIRFRVFIPRGQGAKVCRDAALITQGARLFRDAINQESKRRQKEDSEIGVHESVMVKVEN